MQGGHFFASFVKVIKTEKEFIVSHKQRQIGRIFVWLFCIIFSRTISSRSGSHKLRDILCKKLVSPVLFNNRVKSMSTLDHLCSVDDPRQRFQIQSEYRRHVETNETIAKRFRVERPNDSSIGALVARSSSLFDRVRAMLVRLSRHRPCLVLFTRVDCSPHRPRFSCSSSDWPRLPLVSYPDFSEERTVVLLARLDDETRRDETRRDETRRDETSLREQNAEEKSEKPRGMNESRWTNRRISFTENVGIPLSRSFVWFHWVSSSLFFSCPIGRRR